MNKVLASCLLAMFGMSVSQAHAHKGVPAIVWACELSAISANPTGGAFIVKEVNFDGVGLMSCVDNFLRVAPSQPVSVSLKGGGLGLVISGPLQKIVVLSLDAGLKSPSHMYTSYTINAGLGVNLLAGSVQAAAGLGRNGVKVSVQLGNDIGLGIYGAAYTMTIRPNNGMNRNRR